MIQRFSVFSGTYDNAIDPRKDLEGDFCYYFDVEPLIAERDTLLDVNADLRSELAWFREGKPSYYTLSCMADRLDHHAYFAKSVTDWLRRLADARGE